MLQYGKDFLAQFQPVTASGRNGAFITSCICHGCPWPSNEIALGGVGAYTAYANWAEGKTTGNASIYIDPRTPNGDGTFTDPRCAKFP